MSDHTNHLKKYAMKSFTLSLFLLLMISTIQSVSATRLGRAVALAKNLAGSVAFSIVTSPITIPIALEIDNLTKDKAKRHGYTSNTASEISNITTAIAVITTALALEAVGGKVACSLAAVATGHFPHKACRIIITSEGKTCDPSNPWTALLIASAELSGFLYYAPSYFMAPQKEKSDSSDE